MKETNGRVGRNDSKRIPQSEDNGKVKTTYPGSCDNHAVVKEFLVNARRTAFQGDNFKKRSQVKKTLGKQKRVQGKMRGIKKK